MVLGECKCARLALEIFPFLLWLVRVHSLVCALWGGWLSVAREVSLRLGPGSQWTDCVVGNR